MGCGASNAASSPAGSNPTVDRPAPLEITRPAGDPPTRRGSNAAERAEAAAEAAASPTSGDRTLWQAAAARQQKARDEALAKLQALGLGAGAQTAALSKAELPGAEAKLNRAEGWLRDLDERATVKEQECERVDDECKQLEELKSGTRKRADMEQLLMSIAVRASETCAAAEAHAVQAVAGLREPTGLEGLAEIAAWQDPPPDALSIFQAVLCLLIGVDERVGSADESGRPQDLEWVSAVCGTSGVLSDPARFAECLEPARTNYLKATADGQAPQFASNATQARALMGQHVGRNLAMDELDDVQSLQTIKLPRNRAVALVCRWVVAHLAYQDAQLLLEERAGEAAFELKVHELAQHRGLHAALLAQREQASSAVSGQKEMVEKLRSSEVHLEMEELAAKGETVAQMEEIIEDYRTTLEEQTDGFDEEGEEDGDEDEEDDDEEEEEEEQVRAGAAALIQSRARGNAARKRVDGMKPDAAAAAAAQSSSSPPRGKSGKMLAVDTDAAPDFESLGPIPEPGMESGVLTVDSAPAAAPEATAEEDAPAPAPATDVGATKAKTRGALLGGLKSGALEAAVAKMEEDTAAEEEATADTSEAAAEPLAEAEPEAEPEEGGASETAAEPAAEPVAEAEAGAEGGGGGGQTAAEKKAEFEKALGEFNAESES